MPHYDYHCKNCGHTLEAFQKMSETPLKTCPKCQQPTLHKGPGGGIGLSFKGSGFYITDYASPSSQPAPKESNKSGPTCCPCGKGSACDS